MSKNDRETSFGTIFLYIYLILSQIMTAYFFWQYTKDHGFLSSILFGPFLSEFKGLFWIFFIWW